MVRRVDMVDNLLCSLVDEGGMSRTQIVSVSA